MGQVREEVAQFLDDQPLHLIAGKSLKLPGGTYNDLQIKLAGGRLTAVKYPLPDAVHQHKVWQFGQRAIQPQVDTGNRRIFQMMQTVKLIVLCDKTGRQQIEQAVERHGVMYQSALNGSP